MADRFTRPVARVRRADSGGIKLLAQHSVIKAPVLGDDKGDVRLPEGPYRIVMLCRNGSGVTKKETVFLDR